MQNLFTQLDKKIYGGFFHISFGLNVNVFTKNKPNPAGARELSPQGLLLIRCDESYRQQRK